MEIELHFDHANRAWLPWAIALGALALLVALGSIGRMVTPVVDGQAQILTWDGWKLHQAQTAYAREIILLRAEVDALAILMKKSPDPVASQVLFERISRQVEHGQEALTPARAAILTAARAVRDWSAGLGNRENAVRAIENAASILGGRP